LAQANLSQGRVFFVSIQLNSQPCPAAPLKARAMASSRTRAVSCPSQAKLLNGRGDLRGKRGSFDVKLERPSPGALMTECPFGRIGMDLRRCEVPERLLVAGVDTNPSRKTPVARWNTQEERQAIRTDAESHQSLALLPGDRLRAINGVNGKTAMLAELVEAMSSTSPRDVNLAISRNIPDVMAPSPKLRAIVGSMTPPKLPRLSKQSDSMTTLPAIHGSPPRTPPRVSCSGSSSRSASASSVTSTMTRSGSKSSVTSSRSRSGSRRASMRELSSWGQIDCGQGIGVSLSYAGRMAVAF